MEITLGQHIAGMQLPKAQLPQNCTIFFLNLYESIINILSISNYIISYFSEFIGGTNTCIPMKSPTSDQYHCLLEFFLRHQNMSHYRNIMYSVR